MLVFFIEENAFPSESVLALSQDAFLGNEARSSQASQSRAELVSARFLHRRKRVSVGKRLGIKPRRFSSETRKINGVPSRTRRRSLRAGSSIPTKREGPLLKIYSIGKADQGNLKIDPGGPPHTAVGRSPTVVCAARAIFKKG